MPRTRPRAAASAPENRRSRKASGRQSKGAPGKRPRVCRTRAPDTSALRDRAERRLRGVATDSQPAVVRDPKALIHELRVHQAELEIQNEELRNAQVELAAVKDRYTDLYEFAPVGYLTVDERGVVREANLMAATLLGVAGSRLLGANVRRFIEPRARDEWRRYHGRVLVATTKQICELPVRTDGVSRAVRFESLNLAQAECRCVLIDVTESRDAESRLGVSNRELRSRIAENERIEHALLEERARLRTIVQTAADGIVTLDGRGTIETMNPAAERIFGYTAAELIGRNVGLLMVPSGRDAPEQLLLRFAKSGERRGPGMMQHEVVGRRKDGTTFAMELTLSEFFDSEPKFTGVVRDITERRRLQREIVQRVTEEQKSIGRTLHDGVAQQITGTEMMAGVLLERLRAQSLPEAETLAEILGAIRDAQVQLRGVIRGVLPYAVAAAGLDTALRELASTTNRMQGAECTFDRDGAVEITDAIHATQLYYVASEAVHNAVRHAGASRIVIRLARENGLVELSVRDDGVGIQPAQIEQGAGTQIMRYRASLIDADLEIHAPESGGTVVRCRLRPVA
jgi:two-component system sensor kinase FixL